MWWIWYFSLLFRNKSVEAKMNTKLGNNSFLYQPKLYKVSWYILKHTILQNIHGKCMDWHLKNKIPRKWKMPIMHFLHTFVKKRRWHLDKSVLLSRSTYSIQASFKESKRQFWLLLGATTTMGFFPQQLFEFHSLCIFYTIRTLCCYRVSTEQYLSAWPS